MLSTKLPPLTQYVELREFLPAVEQSFPSEESLKWFIRRNRQALVDSGALIIITGRMRVHPASFQKAVVQIGRQAASGRAA